MGQILKTTQITKENTTPWDLSVYFGTGSKNESVSALCRAEDNSAHNGFKQKAVVIFQGKTKQCRVDFYLLPLGLPSEGQQELEPSEENTSSGLAGAAAGKRATEPWGGLGWKGP